MEIWKKIEDYGGLFEVSNTGKVRDINKKIKPMYKNNKGYYLLSLYYKGKTYHPLIHRLVAKAFIVNPNNYNQVNHIVCNKSNSKIENLEWCNQRYNYNEGMKTFQYSKNENHYFAKLKNYDIFIIYKLFELGFDFTKIKITKYKDLPNIKLPSNIRDYLKDNTVLNTLIAQGKVSV